jgi:hypothetical protein
MDCAAFSTHCGSARPRFKAVVMTPVSIAGDRARIRKNAVRSNQSGNCISEFDFCVTNAMPAHDNAAGLGHFRQSTAHDLFEDVQISILWKAHDRQSADWPAAHRVDVAQCIGGGNLAEEERVVYQRRKEIDGLNESKVRRNLIDACVIGGVETNQQVWVPLFREP